MKKLISIALALSLIFAFAVNVFATAPENTEFIDTSEMSEEKYEELYAAALATIPEGAVIGEPIVYSSSTDIFSQSNPMYTSAIFTYMATLGGRYGSYHRFDGNQMAVSFEYEYQDNSDDHWLMIELEEDTTYKTIGSATAYAQNQIYSTTMRGLKGLNSIYRFWYYTQKDCATYVQVVAIPYYLYS